MGTEADLIVDVEEHNTCVADINSVCQGLDGMIASLIQHLQTANAAGLESGQSAESFSAFVSEIARMAGKLKEVGSSINTIITDFLSAIDDADDLLFTNTGRKPFTDEEFDACFAVVDNTTSPSLNGDALTGFFSGWFDKLIKIIYKLLDLKVTIGNDESILRGNVEKLKERTVEKIATIKAGVRSADRTSRQSLKNQLDILKNYERALRKIDSIVSSEGGAIDATKLATLTSFLDQLDLFASSPTVVTDDDVIQFSDNVTGYFDSSTDVIGSICDASLGGLVTSDFDRYRETVDGMREYFNSYSSDYTESHEKYERYKNRFDKILKLYNEYGSKWVDYYDGDKKAAERFNKLVKKTGKNYDDYVDIWFQLFCDMSESEEAFARFKANCDLDNEVVRKALERVEALYEGEVDAYVYDTLEHTAQLIKKEVTQKGVKEAVKAYSKILSNTGVDQIIANAASNILDKAYSEASAVAQYDQILATQNSFDNAVADLKAATPGTDGYDVLVQTVRKSFDYAKQARIKFFTTMAKSASGQEKRFYQLNIESLKTMSLDDVTRHRAITPGEYYGENASIFGYLLDGDIEVSFAG